jgi:hypothetical protein
MIVVYLGGYDLWSTAGSGSDLVAQRVLGNGERAKGWPTSGLHFALAQRPRILPPNSPFELFSDGSGGAFVIWNCGGTCLQRISGDGTYVVGTFLEGRVIAAAYPLDVASDQADGAYVLFNGPEHTLRLARVDRDGLPRQGWETPVSIGTGDWGWISVTRSGVVNVLAYVFNAFLGDRLYLRRIGGDATAGPVVDVPFPSSGSQTMTLVSDGAEGFYVQKEGGLANHVDEFGSLSWPVDLILPGRLLPDGKGGLYAVEQDPITVRRLDSSGVPARGWPEAGVRIEGGVGPDSQFEAKLFHGGVMMAWSSGDFSPLLATYVTQNGEFGAGWSPGGNVVSRASGFLGQPTLVPQSQSHALVAWTRNAESEVWVGSLRSVPPVRAVGPEPIESIGPSSPSVFFLRVPQLVSHAGHLVLEGEVPEPASATIDLHDVTGRLVHRERIESGAGPFSQRVTVARLSAGIYWAKLTQGARQTSARFVIL